MICSITENFKFNKVVSSYMTFLNENKNLTIECKNNIVDLLSVPSFRRLY